MLLPIYEILIKTQHVNILLKKTLKAKFLIALQTVALYPDYELLHYKKRAKARSLYIVYFL